MILLLLNFRVDLDDEYFKFFFFPSPDNPTMLGQETLEVTTSFKSSKYNLEAGDELNITTGENCNLGDTVKNTINLEDVSFGMEFIVTT